MKIIIDMPKRHYEQLAIIANEGIEPLGYFERVVVNGTPLRVSDDGTLEITVDDYFSIKRVLVQDKNKWGGLFYADNN